MSLNPEPADPGERQDHHLPPKSYADAVEQEIPPTPVSFGNFIDEDSIKESPPRLHTRQGSEPRPLGEMLDESESQSHQNGDHMSLPSTPVRIGRKPVPGKSFADAAAEGTNGTHPKFDMHDDAEQYTGAGMDESPRSPIRKPHKRTPSRSTPNGQKKDDSDGSQRKLVYEEVSSKDGEQLTSVKPQDNFDTEPPVEEKSPQEQKPLTKEELVSGRRAGAGWERSAIHWAPLNVPLQRRLQTFMVLAHTLSIASFLAFFFLLCTIPLLWPLLLPYLVYVLFSKAGTSGTLSYRSEALRRLPIWSLFASYFPARLHRSQTLPATRKYVFGYHPHGIISHGAFAAFATEALGFAQLFPGITNTLLTLDSNFRIPLYRDYALCLGLASVSRESCENILSKGGPNGEGMGRGITIVVGGARESLDAQPNSLRLVLARRKGFIKLAIRTGADLVPVLAFGENELYEQFDPEGHPAIHKAQLLVKKFMGFTVPLFHARGVFNYDVGMMPYRRPLNIVVGRPVMVERQERPDAKYVDEIHAKYVQELKRIWDEWKDTFAKHRDGELEIVE
ncbi:hypothetical protein MBLNU459_g0244t1 [Dothideomycetes sp. NU459]